MSWEKRAPSWAVPWFLPMVTTVAPRRVPLSIQSFTWGSGLLDTLSYGEAWLVLSYPP